MRKIFVVGSGIDYANWMEGELVRSIEDADLVVFTGGEDVNPNLYGAKCHPYTSFSNYRDDKEISSFQLARKLNKKMIGICRGAQFLCVMAGGSLVQHQSHPSTHYMRHDEGMIVVTSSHHQRQYPWGNKKPNFELLGWCDNLSPINEGEPGEDLKGKPEVEIALYPEIKALAIQSHPEWSFPSTSKWQHQYIEYCQQLLNKHMTEELTWKQSELITK